MFSFTKKRECDSKREIVNIDINKAFMYDFNYRHASSKVYINNGGRLHMWVRYV